MLPLYPDIKSYVHHRVAVDTPHELYIEECGSPSGIPILFVHGGPGAGFGPKSRRFFNPEKYRIILFDQRGSGQSSPHAELENNTTQLLLDDMEVIREFLGIDKWVLFGGSWGATLSLLYAQRYPERMKALILRGVFLGRQRDLDWLYQDGASRLFPDAWQRFIAPVEKIANGDNVKAYYSLLTGENELARMAAAKAWSIWEAQCSTLRPSIELIEAMTGSHSAYALARIEAHYCANKFFLTENQILEDAHKLFGIPGVIIHGRYDVVCPLENAYLLHQQWSDSELQIIRDAGHSAFEPSIADALVRATDALSKQLED